MNEKTICPNCGAEIKKESKFCSECGAAIPAPAAQRLTHCPNPACGQALEGQEKFCPACGEKIQNIPEVEKGGDQTAKPQKTFEELWTDCATYIKQTPQGERIYDARIIAEIVKALMAQRSILLSNRIDYTLFDMESECDLNMFSETWPKVVYMPNMEGLPYYTYPSLDTEEFKVWTSKMPEINLNMSELETKQQEIKEKLCTVFSIPIHAVLESTKTKYENMLINGQTRALVEKVTLEEFLSEAGIYYKAYEKKNLDKARKGFESLVKLNPFDTYAHNMLHAIYWGMRDYQRAFEEIVYAGFLEDDSMRSEREKGKAAGEIKRNLHVVSNRANWLRKLGLYPALYSTFQLSTIEELSKEFEDEKETVPYSELMLYRNLAITITYGITNLSLLASLFQRKEACEGVRH